MAGKEAIVYLVDCNKSMAGQMDMARKALRALMVQKMLQSKQNELGVVLFGLPEEETFNKLHQDGGGYEGVKELCILDRGSIETLRKLGEIDVPDSDNTEGRGDVLDAMVVGLHMIRQRTLKKAFLRHVYLLTDAATPVEGVDQLENIVNMYVDPCMQCKLHFVGLGSEASGASVVVKEEGGSQAAVDNKPPSAETIKEQNEMMLASVSAATKGSVLSATAVVDGMGESTIKTANPVLSKVDLMMGSKLSVHCRYFKKVDTGLKESLKKESIAPGGGAGGGRVRVDRTYRDPERPEVEMDFENQIKGYRYGQDYIPVGSLDEGSLKLPEEGPSLKVLGFVAASSVPRHIFMDETYVVVAEPESAQSAGAVSSLVRAMKNLNQVALVRFVKRKNSEPWLGVLIPDPTGVVSHPRWLFQKLPFSEDVRDYTFPSFSKAPSSRKPSAEQERMSGSLIEAMMIPEIKGEPSGVRDGLVLNPVRQGINGAKVARAIVPECDMPSLPPSVKAGVCPDPFLLEKAAPVFEEYLGLFQFEKQVRAKAGKQRVTYFSDLTLAEPDASKPGSSNSVGAEAGPPPKKSKTDKGNAPSEDKDAASTVTGTGISSCAPKVGSIDPISDFESMMAAARSGDEGGAELADRAVTQMQGVILSLINKGTTASLKAKALSCIKALRQACVSHFMGKNYNDFLQEVKGHQQDDSQRTEVWEMAAKDPGAWPITSEDDAGLSMTPQAAAEFMTAEAEKGQEEEGAHDAQDDDDDLDDMA
ncbi:unnamed protein product [Ascophyllum nodosum]